VFYPRPEDPELVVSRHHGRILSPTGTRLPILLGRFLNAPTSSTGDNVCVLGNTAY
jgi:hypothetical protein